MLARRIIPCLDVSEGRVVKGTQFQNIIDVDDPATLGRRYASEGADELVFYDITASAENRPISHEFVAQVAREINIPFAVGGGIRSLEDIHFILRQGADKVSLNSSAVAHPQLIQAAANRFGSQCIVLSMDVKKIGSSYRVTTQGGRHVTDLEALAWAEQGVALGAGEIVLNTMDTDGVQGGYDVALIEALTRRVNVPVIASGGAGKVDDFVKAAAAGADGLLAASVFHFGTLSIAAVKDALDHAGFPVRKEEHHGT